MLAVGLLNLGANFINEVKEEEQLKYFLEQKDSIGRTALEIMSRNKYYRMLESAEMGMIIKEKWHGYGSQSFGMHHFSTNYKIINSNYDQEESKRLFLAYREDSKTFIF